MSENKAFRAIQRLVPDLLIVDVVLLQSNRLDLVKRLRSRVPDLKCWVIKRYCESSYAMRALQAGGSGYRGNRATESLLLDAIHSTLRGERFTGPILANRSFEMQACGHTPTASSIENHSDRDLETSRWFGRGLTTRQIARKLVLSVHPLDTHRENIKRKLALRSAPDRTLSALQWVLENPL